jgi:hypothetical protein
MEHNENLQQDARTADNLLSANSAFETNLKALLEKHPKVCADAIGWVSGNLNYTGPAYGDLEPGEPIMMPGSFAKLGSGSSNALPGRLALPANLAVIRALGLAMSLLGRENADLFLHELMKLRFPDQRVRPLLWEDETVN